jgi:hypothetical protein
LHVDVREDQPRLGVIGTKRALLEGSFSVAAFSRSKLSKRSMNISASMMGLRALVQPMIVGRTDGAEVQVRGNAACADVI